MAFITHYYSMARFVVAVLASLVLPVANMHNLLASAESICSRKTGGCPQRHSADGFESLMQESVVTTRSHSQSLMQESFKLHRSHVDSGDAASEHAELSADGQAAPQQPAAAGALGAAKLAQPHPLLPPTHTVARVSDIRPSNHEGQPAEVLAEVARANATAPASTAPAANATAVHPLAFTAEDPSKLAPPEILPRPPHAHHSPHHVALQAEGSEAIAKDQTKAAVEPAPTVSNMATVNTTMMRSEDRYLQSVGFEMPSNAFGIIKAVLLVACVACILRALISKMAVPCRRFGLSSSSLATGAEKPPANHDAGMFLCPELVVPEGKECKLVVPKLQMDGLGNGGKIAICDQQGLPVLTASYSCFSGATGRGTSRPKDLRRLMLTSATGETVFASCRDAEVDPGALARSTRLVLQGRSEEPFGSLSADGYQSLSGYSVITQKGSAVYFRAGLKAGVMNATDDSGRLLAVIEPSGPTHTLIRVGQFVDAGLITITMMGIDILEQGGRSNHNVDLATL